MSTRGSSPSVSLTQPELFEGLVEAITIHEIDTPYEFCGMLLGSSCELRLLANQLQSIYGNVSNCQ